MHQPNPIFASLPTTIFTHMSALAVAHGAINLGQGFPDEDGPLSIREAAARALADGPNQYPPMRGLPQLRKAICAHAKRFYDLDFDSDANVVVTSGGTEALTASIMALAGEGGEVLLIEPAYDSYAPIAEAVGARVKTVKLAPPDWRLDAEALAAAMTPETRVLMLNTPLNPIGRAFTREELEGVAQVLARSNAVAVCDEVYEHLIFDGREHIPLIALPGMAERVVRVGSAGKMFSLTGWKIGWVTGPQALIDVIAKAHQFITFTSSPALQFGIAHALEHEMGFTLNLTKAMQTNRDLLAERLPKIGFDVLPCEGSYFLTAGIRGLTNESDRAFCERLVREAGVALIPLSVFFSGRTPDHLVRFAFCKKRELLEQALARLENYFSRGAAEQWSVKAGVVKKEPHELTAAELSTAFANRDLSPVEVMDACLARIEALDAEINAFCFVDPEASRKQAEESEQRWMEGAPLSPLDGVPVAIKDLLLTKNWPTRRGSLTVDPKGPWTDDAPSVARLREAGAVLIGKTTTPEFGWKGTTDSPLTGTTRNPWNKAKTPGGSSGGSAAALAARFAPLALGTDGGGSIRIPAGFSGVFGLKPSFGRAPAWPLSPFGTVAHVGPMSRTVLDSAMLLNAIAKPDARDWHALQYEPTDYTSELESCMRGKRIAFSPRLGHVRRIAPEVEELAAVAAKRFEQLGAHVEQVDPPGGDRIETFRTLWWAGAAFLLGDLPDEKKAQLDPGLRQMAEEGAQIPLKRYLSANAARGQYGSAVRQFMTHYDFLLTPALATPAFDAGQLSPVDEDGNAWMNWTPFTFPFNLTQQPAASIPCGFTGDGLPVGLQIVGRMFDDAGVLAAAAAYELADPHFDKTPPGF